MSEFGAQKSPTSGKFIALSSTIKSTSDVVAYKNVKSVSYYWSLKLATRAPKVAGDQSLADRLPEPASILSLSRPGSDQCLGERPPGNPHHAALSFKMEER